MSHHVTAVYPGTFDPLTLGHEDVVRRASRLFGRVIVAVAVAHHKKTLFSLDERMGMVREALHDCPQVEVAPFEGLVTEFVAAQGGTVMVRGVRSATDFDYEFQLAGMNRALMPHIDTLFLPPSTPYQFISSTLVREIATLGGEVAQFVSSGVHHRLMEKIQKIQNPKES